MAEPMKKPDESPRSADEAQAEAARYHDQAPTETTTHGMEREPEGKRSLSEDIRAHTIRPHKGDVGRPGTNEEIYQGSKQREL
ncbi:MAG TPA: hypothetical protein VHX37_00370 [Acidobacteriaceae bacterium]|jgi:hypothetical protein|nr:hypothetical protein [Acidobacteriaceae bacterium]